MKPKRVAFQIAHQLEHDAPPKELLVQAANELRRLSLEIDNLNNQKRTLIDKLTANYRTLYKFRKPRYISKVAAVRSSS